MKENENENENQYVNQFYNLYCKIINAEIQNRISNQEVIKYYYLFGKVSSERLEFHKKFHLEHEAQKAVNVEIRQQLPNNITNDNLRKRKEKAKKIYNLFSQVGEEKLIRIKSISASYILKLNSKEIQYIVEEILKKNNVDHMMKL